MAAIGHWSDKTLVHGFHSLSTKYPFIHRNEIRHKYIHTQQRTRNNADILMGQSKMESSLFALSRSTELSEIQDETKLARRRLHGTNTANN